MVSLSGDAVVGEFSPPSPCEIASAAAASAAPAVAAAVAPAAASVHARDADAYDGWQFF